MWRQDCRETNYETDSAWNKLIVQRHTRTTSQCGEGGNVKKTVLEWRDAQIAHVLGNIFNLSCMYVYCACEFKLCGRLSAEF